MRDNAAVAPSAAVAFKSHYDTSVSGGQFRFCRWLSDVSLRDLPAVGGKNASLGELIGSLKARGVRVPDGFATSSDAYWHFVRSNEGLEDMLRGELSCKLDRDDAGKMNELARRVQRLVMRGAVPPDMEREVRQAYRRLSGLDPDKEHETGKYVFVAVRSSATAEDLPNASFAGQQDTYLHVHGEADLLHAWKRCVASLFTSRAIVYRHDHGFDHMQIALSVGVQRMVMSGTGCSGVMFTLDTESGHRDVITVDATYGIGENVVQGMVGPDSFLVHKPTLKQGYRSVVMKRVGPKELRMVYDDDRHKVRNVTVPAVQRNRLCIGVDDVLTLARWGVAIEEHYGAPMDIEWAKDGASGELYIVQARNETVHSLKTSHNIKQYTLKGHGGENHAVLGTGIAVGEAIGCGAARVLESPSQIEQFRAGEILVTDYTDPNWDPIMKVAGAIVTQRGGRCSHAAIVAREIGVPCIVGAAGAMSAIAQAQQVTVSCCEGDTGRIYDGVVDYEVEEIDPHSIGATRTKIMMNVARPDRAFSASLLPSDGVGLCRMEFVFADWIGVHPMALLRFDEMERKVQSDIERAAVGYDGDYREFFVDKLAQGMAMIAAAFYPRPVVVRLSDFKTNEYAGLLGGQRFEPHEENPMLGWRGAARYYNDEYKQAFLLEVAAIKRVRDGMGLTNVKVMVPFCRTPVEGRRVVDVMAEGGLVQGENGLQVLAMAEVPSVALEIEAFSEVFHGGFSIGSNDLTQLVLGIDRDSERVAQVFDEREPAVKQACSMIIRGAHAAKCGRRNVGICGQAPSDYPEFAAFLVEEGIDSISLNQDAIVSTKRAILEMERKTAGGEM